MPGAGVADVLADVKPFNSSIGVPVFHLDAAHFPGRGTQAKPRLEIFEKMDRTRGVGLHASIRQVANPALQLELPGHARRELAITDALHLTRYPILTRSHTYLMLILIDSAARYPRPAAVRGSEELGRR